MRTSFELNFALGITLMIAMLIPQYILSSPNNGVFEGCVLLCLEFITIGLLRLDEYIQTPLKKE
jgi:hypothetical protein